MWRRAHCVCTRGIGDVQRWKWHAVGARSVAELVCLKNASVVVVVIIARIHTRVGLVSIARRFALDACAGCHFV